MSISMKATTDTPAKRAPRETLNLRIAAAERGLIDRAARVAGKTRTDFIVDTVKQVAEDTVLDQRLFLLNHEQWAKFMTAS